VVPKENEIRPMLPTMPQRRSAIALRRAAQGEGTRTIVIALIANLVIGIAKLIGGLVSGSSGMLAEAAHSAADSVSEIFLAVGLHRDREPPDAAHPDGHGRERFLWAFMAAIASFLIGGCLSHWLLQGSRHAILSPAVLRRGSFSPYRSQLMVHPGCRACGRHVDRPRNTN
jgi:hypothetical protein